tara:strand:+ start:541 stop:1377 length:837 start_codon:yes stop_codon:yes gene_type:complete
MQQVQKTKKNEVANPISLMEEFAGQGNENITATDVKLPILKVVGSMSDFIKPQSPSYNEKLKIGDIYNSVSGSIYSGDKGVLAVPCYYINTYNEWEERGQGQGRPYAIHTDSSIMKNTERGEDNKDWVRGVNKPRRYVEDTGNHFCYLLDENMKPLEQVLITMKSTQKKKSRLWNSMMQTRRMKRKDGTFFQPPSFGTVYKLKTIPESNSKGSWHGWSIDFVDFLKEQDTFDVCAEFYKQAKESDIFSKVDHEEELVKDSSKVQPEVREKKQSEDVPF